MIYLNLFFIAIIVTCIVDLSGIVESIKYGISWILTKGKLPKTNYRIKPFDCSLCMTFWTGLIYLLVIGQVTLPLLAFLLLLAISTILIKETITLLKDIVLKLINVIYDKFID